MSKGETQRAKKRETFKPGDAVRINVPRSQFHAKTGTICKITKNPKAYWVRVDGRKDVDSIEFFVGEVVKP